MPASTTIVSRPLLRRAYLRTTAPTTAASPHRSRLSSTYAHLARELPARRLPPIYSDLTPGNSHALAVALSAFLPASWTTATATTALPPNGAGTPALPPAAPDLALPPAHHLVYFNPVIPADRLLPDGTDPLQSPGEPFVRRMWAGGSVRFAAPAGAGAAGEGGSSGASAAAAGGTEQVGGVTLDGERWVCVEGIRDVAVKGRAGEEKVFVGIERRVGRAVTAGVGAVGEEGEEAVRRRLWMEREEEWGEARLVERRNIVFMRGRSPEEAAVEVARGQAKMLKPQNTPDFSHTLTPTPSLLFRYSALTFNAHAIHLDPQYCQTVEGHRNLLFHGPLSFTLLVTLLQNNLPAGHRIKEVEYRNLAPLYCGEPVKLCGRQAPPNGRGDAKFELWAETPEGGLAVKGTAYTAKDA